MPRCNKCAEHCDELEGVFVYEDCAAVFYCDDCYIEMRPRPSLPPNIACSGQAATPPENEQVERNTPPATNA